GAPVAPGVPVLDEPVPTGCGLDEVTPRAPAAASGWKNTTKSNDGALAPHPDGVELVLLDEVTDAAAAAVSDFCELPSVTRVTPRISRSRDISRATSSCDCVQPRSSNAGAAMSPRNELPPP